MVYTISKSRLLNRDLRAGMIIESEAPGQIIQSEDNRNGQGGKVVKIYYKEATDKWLASSRRPLRGMNVFINTEPGQKIMIKKIFPNAHSPRFATGENV